MKPNIHPNWHDDSIVTCSCGNSFLAGSPSQTIKIDICNKCHPFFTGEMKFVDVQGRVEKFQAKQQAAAKIKAKVSTKKAKKQESDQPVKTLKDMLQTIKTETNTPTTSSTPTKQ